MLTPGEQDAIETAQQGLREFQESGLDEFRYCTSPSWWVIRELLDIIKRLTEPNNATRSRAEIQKAMEKCQEYFCSATNRRPCRLTGKGICASYLECAYMEALQWVCCPEPTVQPDPDIHSKYKRVIGTFEVDLPALRPHLVAAEKERFEEHLKWCSRIVSTWPEWKKNVLGSPINTPTPNPKTTNEIMVAFHEKHPQTGEMTDERRRQIQEQVRQTKGAVEKKARRLYETLSGQPWPESDSEILPLKITEETKARYRQKLAAWKARQNPQTVEEVKAALEKIGYHIRGGYSCYEGKPWRMEASKLGDGSTADEAALNLWAAIKGVKAVEGQQKPCYKEGHKTIHPNAHMIRAGEYTDTYQCPDCGQIWEAELPE